MAFPTAPQETLKYFLFKVMSEEDATRFMSLKEVLAACEEENPKWQAVYALSVHLHAIGRFRQTAEFSNYLTQQKFTEIHHGLYSEALSRSTDRYLGKEPWMHWLWELLITQLAYSEYKSTDVMEMFASVLSHDVNAQGRPFVAYGKLMAGNTLMPLYLVEANYKAAVEAMTKVAECLPTEDVFTQLDQLVDHWVFQCENIPVQEYSIEQDKMNGHCPEVEGRLVDLLDSVASAVGTCHNSLGDEEVSQLLLATDLGLGKAGKTSSEYWAWKFGHVLGRLSHRDRIVHQNLLALCCWGDIGNNAPAIASLLLSREVSTDWQQAHEYMRGMAMFRSSAEHGTNVDLSNVSPTSRLYWAMRIGFADAMLEKTVAVVLQAPLTVKDLQIGTTLTYADLTQLEILNQIKKKLDRLPPSLEEIETYLLETLDDTFDGLPLQVRDHLKQAELDFRNGTRQSNAKVEFVKTVEAALDCLFVSPIRSYYKQSKLEWPFTELLPNGTKPEYGIRKWGEHFCKLAQPISQQLGNINQPGITRFLKENYPDLNYCELEGLGKSLQDVQKLRGSSGHYQSQFPLNKEIAQLKELRNMVLGLNGGPSIIKQMVELFGGKPQNLLPGSTG